MKRPALAGIEAPRDITGGAWAEFNRVPAFGEPLPMYSGSGIIGDGLDRAIAAGIKAARAARSASRRLVSLPLAPESQGLHQLTARFENVPARMWADFPAGVPRPTGPINLIRGAAYDIAVAAKKAVNQRLSRGFNLGPVGYDIHEIVPVKYGGSPTNLANKVGLFRPLHRRATAWFNRLQGLIEGE